VERRARHRLGQTLLLGAAVVLNAGCPDELPAGPDVLAEGVVVYEKAGFTGDSARLTADVSNFDEYN
jgi:hypothetical protein